MCPAVHAVSPRLPLERETERDRELVCERETENECERDTENEYE